MSTRVERGRRAEAAVADYLRALGYAIIARNVRVGALEIDLVARKGALVAIVEVRLRGEGAFEGALASVSREKRARLVRAAERLWRERFAAMPEIDRLRIDVAAVHFEAGKTYVEYVAGAIVA